MSLLLHCTTQMPGYLEVMLGVALGVATILFGGLTVVFFKTEIFTKNKDNNGGN